MALDAESETPDEALLVRYANGDRTAAYVLTHRLTPRIMGYAARLLGGDRAEAEDVAQEAMVRLWRMAPEWRQEEARVSSWLYRVATNLCTDRLRMRQRRKRYWSCEIVMPASPPPASSRKPTITPPRWPTVLLPGSAKIRSITNRKGMK
ncbi:MAG: hypothetical protein HC844_19430 [Tabrizicola sp.]|nr:hypothetical protein [Tabrizicola sp.]